jgi:two-component sensor histidine kinase
MRAIMRLMDALAARIAERYAGSLNKNTIEYWQGYVFHLMALPGLALGAVCVGMAATVLVPRGQWLSCIALAAILAANGAIILARRVPLKAKTRVIALNFYFIGVLALYLGGPDGESGIFFTVSVLISSLFVGYRSTVAYLLIDFATAVGFGALHAAGRIDWDSLNNFRFASWVLQAADVFLIDLILAIATFVLIKGVGETFRSLKSAEAELRVSLDEKETLIRELYHRTKNNMQVVSSLLALHAPELGSEEAKAVFKDVNAKIVAMSMVHEKLYESRDLSNINLADYIRDLAALLAGSYGAPPGRVAFDLDLEDTKILIDTAIPCGLVVSEIVANSLKHAFPGGRRGRIAIALKGGAADTVELRISDDGIGLPEGFDPALHGRMGMKTLFQVAAHQLQGSIELSSTGGAAYVVRFRRSLYAERVRVDG